MNTSVYYNGRTSYKSEWCSYTVPANAQGETVFTLKFFTKNGQKLWIDEIEIKEVSVNSVHDIRTDDIVTLSPNPATTQLTVETEGTQISSITIYDVNGAMLINKDALSTSKHILSTEHLSSGIYFVKVMSDNTMSVERLIIK
jgi:hypothetical protein